MGVKLKCAKHCKFSVVGMEMNCPVCGHLVLSGYSHECTDKDGIIEARTWATGLKEFGGVFSRMPSFDEPGPREEPESVDVKLKPRRKKNAVTRRAVAGDVGRLST